jgi:hypothetical protein
MGDGDASRKCAYEPEHDEDDKNETEYTAETGAAVATMGIVPAAAAKENNQQNYY